MSVDPCFLAWVNLLEKLRKEGDGEEEKRKERVDGEEKKEGISP